MSEEFKVIETQEDFDRAINDRLERERNTVRKEFEGFLFPCLSENVKTGAKPCSTKALKYSVLGVFDL